MASPGGHSAWRQKVPEVLEKHPYVLIVILPVNKKRNMCTQHVASNGACASAPIARSLFDLHLVSLARDGSGPLRVEPRAERFYEAAGAGGGASEATAAHRAAQGEFDETDVGMDDMEPLHIAAGLPASVAEHLDDTYDDATLKSDAALGR
ncbi:hypothetical protein PPROV_000946500 [Pycnococcus provasolii]|uniref:Uncharacterized protein n=1 Tax=Pycnococcus provasolii TaxID=41880 RepID=A0A830HU62_9CHLO|nr:hypothetical protein PPROV_000946500 [Pycnococcus provasolii]